MGNISNKLNILPLACASTVNHSSTNNQSYNSYNQSASHQQTSGADHPLYKDEDGGESGSGDGEDEERSPSPIRLTKSRWRKPKGEKVEKEGPRMGR